MRYLKWIVISFVVLCGLLVVDSGLFKKPTQGKKLPILLQQTTTTELNETSNIPEAEDPNASENNRLQADTSVSLDVENAPAKTIVIGAADPKTEDPETGYKFQLDLSTKGAGILKATFSDGNDKGFDNRDYQNPQPLQIISPMQDSRGNEILSMMNREFVLVDYKQQLPLQNLQWQSSDVNNLPGVSQSVSFEALIKIKGTNEQVIKLIKTYTVHPRTYLLDCNITIENLSAAKQDVRFNLTGPGGLEREGFRSDLRKIIGGFRENDSVTREILNKKNILKAKTTEDTRLTKSGADFLWAASVNKYFAAIVVPLPEQGQQYCAWIADKTGHLYYPEGAKEAGTGNEMLAVNLKTEPISLAAKDQPGSTKTYRFEMYIGPKDKSLFNKNKLYSSLGFAQTIDFMTCCCPAGIINPLAFGIMALMKWMYSFIPNYGVVIIILVFLVRLVLHPITKKSQVSMSKMSKLGPMTEEIKKKYANNKAEMNKQLMALYREQGASPIMGFLPMLIQMPILIALWSAIYTSIDLRGAPFLPFWITDLSVPDALFTFHTITIPIIGAKISSLNLLPILMGVAMYFQQALMPTQAAANPQVAQQQKIMKIMFPIMLPVILYNGPSGVNLYFMSSTFAGVIEQYVIRKHIREKEEAESKGLVATTKKTGGKVKKKKPKPFYKNM